tara:strand:- start:1852 stop:2013 length:162 start_codon:yes stop_codon:yes gene_type:complete
MNNRTFDDLGRDKLNELDWANFYHARLSMLNADNPEVVLSYLWFHWVRGEVSN